jgi:serralysin
VVYTAAGTDPDAGNTILWSLAAGGDSSLLNINANTGEVRLNASANYAFKSTYIFTVVATDNGGLTNSRAVTLNVPNPNQAPTNITLSSAAVVEAAANGLEIGTLAAVDANATDTHTYTLLANPDGRFSIAGNKLVVASGVRLDFEQATSHSITVRATDSAGATFDKNFTIAVTDASPEVVMGDATGNIIKGGAGHDSLDGGAGVDTLEGGAGSDTYVVDVLGDVVVENFNGGDDVVRVAGASYVLAANVYVETLEAAVLTGTTALNLTGNDFGVSIKGNDGNNLLTGGSGSDLINGRAGTDSLVGGAGNDFYWTDGGDTITETLNAGTDTVYSTVNYVLGTGSNLENLTIFGVATTATGNELDNKLTGNDLANTLTGGAGNDQLDGGLGADTLDGGAGDDWYFVNAASDIVRETSSSGAADRVFASASYTLSNEATYGFVEILSTNDVNGTAAINLTGNTRANQIIGNAGNNIIAGWQGQDTLTGGAGSDTFDFNAIADSTVGITRDRITDFVHLVDKIDLNTIDANATISGNQDFSSVLLNASGAGSAGRIKVYEQGGVATIVEAFVNAGSVADFQIQITGIGLGLTSADFVL